METEILLPVTYACSRCGTGLEVASNSWRDWHRCPSCGCVARAPRLEPYLIDVEEEDEPYYIGLGQHKFAPEPIVPARPIGLRPDDGVLRDGGGSPPYPAWEPVRRGGFAEGDATAKRIAMGAGLFVAAFLALFSVVQKNPAQAGLFGGIAVVLLFLLARSSARA